MVKRICSILTLIVLVLTECFMPMNYALAEDNAEPDFQIEENMNQDTYEEISDDDIESDIEDTVIETGNEELGEGENAGDVAVETGDEETKTGQETEDIQPESENNEELGEGENAGDVAAQTDDEETKAGQETEDIQPEPENDEDNDEESTSLIESLLEDLSDIVKYFFKKEGDIRYIKYGRDADNIGTITLKDPKNGVSITIMDKNLGAESVGVSRNSYGYYFQWGNNHGVKTVDSSNKTTQKAVYKDSYYSYGYDGEGKFIVGVTDYWENGAHYNSLWGNESKESSRYGACPVGYHIPTMKEWNQLLDIWGKIHTQDTSKSEMVLRYSANYSAKNIHTFKGAATQCGQGDTECVDEDKLSVIIDTLSSELKLPLAGSYDENGNFHDGLGAYWTSISKDGNKAGVFDMNAYIGNGTDDTLMYKSQGHNIRCFQNVEPYVSPVEIEEQINPQEVQEEIKENQDDKETQEGNTENQEGEVEQEIQQEQIQKDIPAEFISYLLVLDTTKDFANIELNANGGKFSDEEESKTVKYGYYNQEATIDVNALKQDGYRSGYEIKELPVSPVGYKLMDEVEIPTRDGYIFDGWYARSDGGEKLDMNDSFVLENMEVYAHWVAKEYTITWKNEDGSVRDTTKVAYGQMPTHVDLAQPADEKYTYTFAGWEPEIKEVVGDAEYRAKYMYTLRKYIVIWKNEDETVLKTEGVEYGVRPTYDGVTPTKESTEEYEYTFAGWDKEISEVKGDIEYIARYDIKKIEKQDIQDSSTDNPVSEGQTGSEINSSVSSPNDENISSIVEGGNQGSYGGGGGGNEQNYLDTSEGQEDNKENEDLEENQGFFGGLWETLKSFFLDDEGGYLRGSEIINDIIVSVEAEEGTFPVGTEVVIKGVSQDRLGSIQTSLIEDKSNNVTENTQIAAFDITFVYSGEEIQPEKEVSVKFNYKENSDFQGASEKELSVYHIDDETDEGTEVQVTSKNGDEIEILATDFSIYVLTLSDNNSIILTLNPGEGTIITGDNIVVNEQGIGTITSLDGNVTLPSATRENHVFVGWYTSQTSSLQSFVGGGGDEYHVNADIALYAKWCNDGYAINTDKTTCILEGNLKTILDQNPNFTWGEKEIPMPLGWTNEEDPISIVMMDRNLGATTHGAESNAWGYYYQWGNNYGFTQNPPTIPIDIANVNLSLYAPSTYYSGTYIIGKVNNTTFPSWATTQNYNIWGYNSGTNEAKQGPCPTNWHVPTIEEWNKVVEYWSGNNGGMNVPNFREELGLPLAGGLTRSTAALESGNIAGFYRTVTPNTSKTFAYDFLVKSDLYDVNYSENLVNGRQVRCFKNEDAIVREYTVKYSDGVEDMEIFEDQIFSGLSRGDDFPQFSGTILGRTGNNGVYHEFLGWFLEGTEITFNVSGAKVLESISLYVKWSGCFNENEEVNANGICVPTAEGQRSNQIVQDLELYLLANDQNKIHYTIMDRNMGATEVFNKYYDSPNPASLGCLYQWGNNYGFPAQGDLAQHGVFIRTSQVPKNIWSAGVPSNYASGSYYSNAGSHVSWMGSSSKTDGIWGGTGDTRNANGGNTTLEARQGPCPVGYHVPSTLEWTTIFMDWSGSNIGVSHAKLNNKIPAIYKFSEDLLLPPAGRRGPSGALDYISALSYWSSSPATSDAARADGLYAKPDDKIEIPNADGRSRARSVRCVKNIVNTNATSISTDDIYLDGGGNAVISIDNGVISTLGTPIRADSIFNGWYTTADFSGNPLSTGDTVSAGSSLYAKFTCNESGYVWNGTVCEDGVRLYFDSMGGSDVPSQTVKSGTTGIRPSDPTKTGYVFNGWYLTGETENEFDFTGTILTESTTLYAHWNTGQYEVSIVSNNEDYGTVNSGLVLADYLTPISTNENTLLIGTATVTAIPSTGTEQYIYTFSGWDNVCGDTLTGDCTITAVFERQLKTYTLDLVINTGIDNIYYKVNGADSFMNTGITTTITGVEAGSIIYAYAEPKPGYTTDTSSTNLWSVTVTGDTVFSPVATVSNVEYVVYHYVKRVGSGTYALTKTETGIGMTDEVLTLSSLAKESELLCAHYSRGSLTGTEDGPGEVVTETTIRGDGFTRIYLYYTRNSHTVMLSGDAGVQMLKINGIQGEEAVLECGSDVPVEAVPKPGYHFVRWEEREESEKKGEGDDTGL